MKKFFAGALSCVLALSTVTFTYANNAKDNFLAAFEATAVQVQKENDMIIAADPTAEVFKALSQKDSEIGLNFKINSFESAYPDETTAALDRLSFSFLQNQALKPKKSITNFQLVLPKEIINTAKDLDLNVDLYIDEDKMGVRIPAISDSFYYVNVSDIPELGKKLGINETDLPMFIALLKSLPDMTGSLALGDVTKYQNMLDPYNEIIVNALSNGSFTSLRGEEMVSNGTTFETSKISVTLTSVQVNRLLSNIANQLQDDELIYELYSTVYGGMTPIYASLLPSEYEGDFAAYLIATLCEGLRSINVENDFTYTVCINENNLIVSHRLNFDTDGSSYKFRFDTKGIDYLYNDVFLEFESQNNHWNYTSGIRMYLVGDYIPKNGVTDVQMKFAPYSVYQDSDEYGNPIGEPEEYPSGSFIVDYKWDTNKTTNNFSMNMYTESGDTYDDYSEDFSIDMFSEEEFNYYTSGLSYEEYLLGVASNEDPLSNLYGSYTLEREEFDFYVSDLKSTTYDEYVEQLTYISSYATHSDYEFRFDILGSITANSIQNRVAINLSSIRLEIPYTGVIDMSLKLNMAPGAASKISMSNIKNIMEMDSFTEELLKLQSLFN